MRICIVGTGYVGLVSGICLAERGHTVICADIDNEKVEKIRLGQVPFHEPGLDVLLGKNIEAKRFDATTDLTRAVRQSEVTIIAVGTPFDGHEIDLSFVKQVSAQIGEILKNTSSYHLVIVKSTVVPGTTETVVLPILEETSGKSAGRDFGVGMNPEFLTEGQAVEDFMKPDRIVLGGIDDRSTALLGQVYEAFVGVDIVKTNPRTAEMIKYASNAMLATQISFANEIANLSSSIGGIDAVEVMKGVHLSYYLRPTAKDGSRVQAPISTFLMAGCGFGGSCLPKDVKALISHGRDSGVEARLLQATMAINEAQPGRMVSLLKKHFPVLTGVRVTVLGLSFKPDTDDMRESPAIPIIKHLIAEKAEVRAYDPVAMKEARKVLKNLPIEFADDLTSSVMGSQALLLVTRWQHFERLPELLRSLDPQPLLIDGRRMIDKRLVRRYEGIGL